MCIFVRLNMACTRPSLYMHQSRHSEVYITKSYKPNSLCFLVFPYYSFACLYIYNIYKCLSGSILRLRAVFFVDLKFISSLSVDEKTRYIEKKYPYNCFAMTMYQSLLMALVSLPFCVLETCNCK